jgi:hypothetical protein
MHEILRELKQNEDQVNVTGSIALSQSFDTLESSCIEWGCP